MQTEGTTSGLITRGTKNRPLEDREVKCLRTVSESTFSKGTSKLSGYNTASGSPSMQWELTDESDGSQYSTPSQLSPRDATDYDSDINKPERRCSSNLATESIDLAIPRVSSSPIQRPDLVSRLALGSVSIHDDLTAYSSRPPPIPRISNPVFDGSYTAGDAETLSQADTHSPRPLSLLGSLPEFSAFHFFANSPSASPRKWPEAQFQTAKRAGCPRMNIVDRMGDESQAENQVLKLHLEHQTAAYQMLREAMGMVIEEEEEVEEEGRSEGVLLNYWHDAEGWEEDESGKVTQSKQSRGVDVSLQDAVEENKAHLSSLKSVVESLLSLHVTQSKQSRGSNASHQDAVEENKAHWSSLKSVVESLLSLHVTQRRDYRSLIKAVKGAHARFVTSTSTFTSTYNSLDSCDLKSREGRRFGAIKSGIFEQDGDVSGYESCAEEWEEVEGEGVGGGDSQEEEGGRGDGDGGGEGRNRVKRSKTWKDENQVAVVSLLREICKQVEDARGQESVLRSSLHDVEFERDLLAARLAGLERELQQQQDKERGRQAELQQVRKEAHSAREESTRLSSLISSLETQASQWSSERQKMNARMEELRAEAALAWEEQELTQRDMQETSRERDRARLRADQAVREAEYALVALEGVRVERDEARRECDQARLQALTLTNQITQERATNIKHMVEQVDLRTEAQEATSRSAELEADLAVAKSRTSDLADELEWVGNPVYEIEASRNSALLLDETNRPSGDSAFKVPTSQVAADSAVDMVVDVVEVDSACLDPKINDEHSQGQLNAVGLDPEDHPWKSPDSARDHHKERSPSNEVEKDFDESQSEDDFDVWSLLLCVPFKSN